MKAMALRGIDESIYARIREKSENSHTSMNKFILNLIRERLGSDQKPQKQEFEHFFGTWDKKQYCAFLKNTKSIRKIERELWR